MTADDKLFSNEACFYAIHCFRRTEERRDTRNKYEQPYQSFVFKTLQSIHWYACSSTRTHRELCHHHALYNMDTSSCSKIENEPHISFAIPFTHLLSPPHIRYWNSTTFQSNPHASASSDDNSIASNPVHPRHLYGGKKVWVRKRQARINSKPTSLLRNRNWQQSRRPTIKCIATATKTSDNRTATPCDRIHFHVPFRKISL